MRRSRTITLVLIGSATLSACAPEVAPNYQRDHYTSIEECAADWGRPQDCEPSPGSPYGGGSGYFFRGPMYMPGFRDDAQFAAREQARQEGVAIAQEMVQRVRHLVEGVQLSAPFGRYSMAIEVAEAIGSRD